MIDKSTNQPTNQLTNHGLVCRIEERDVFFPYSSNLMSASKSAAPLATLTTFVMATWDLAFTFIICFNNRQDHGLCLGVRDRRREGKGQL